jgi:hypothetical protein
MDTHLNMIKSRRHASRLLREKYREEYLQIVKVKGGAGDNCNRELKMNHMEEWQEFYAIEAEKYGIKTHWKRRKERGLHNTIA